MNAPTPSFDLTDRVAILTGGAGALGGAMAASLARVGVKVGILSRSAERVNARVEAIKADGGTALALIADVTDREALTACRDQVIAAWGKIDILVNAAGGNLPGATIGPEQTIFDLDLADFERVTRLNLDGTVLPSVIFGEVLANAGRGTIINVSSMAADRALTRVVGYSASKAAVENFTRWMAVELATKFGDGLRVNAIAPGFFIGEQNRRLLTNEDGSLTARGQTIVQQTPMKRFGEADELLGALHWLCSDAASFVTGIVVPVDGGFSAFSGV
jgi:NAD(P)-dependent dehydrogenase (short-subunit alcohol dehydrogenase family)